MAFSDIRKKAMRDIRDRLGEPATYSPVAGGSIDTTLIVHRDRSAQRADEHLAQGVITVTVFRLGDDGDVLTTKTGDQIVLAGSGETFKVSGHPALKDEFKTVVPVTPVT